MEIFHLRKRDFKRVIQWFDQMSQTINFDRTKYLPFSSNKSSISQYHDLNINLNEHQFTIQEENSKRNLGDDIQRQLK